MFLLQTLLCLMFAAAFQGQPEQPPAASKAEHPRVIAEGRQPQAAVDAQGTIWLTYARDNTIWLRSSTDGGETFGPEQKVAKVAAMDVGMRRGPRIAATDSALIVTCIAGEQARGRDGDLLLWRSTDGGKSWSAPRELNSVRGAAREGLQATAAAGKYVAVVWLDTRDKGTTLYGTFSRDGGKTFSPDRMLYASPEGTICECCAPQVAVDERGRVAVQFRNALDGNRDMYLMKSTDGGASFSPARQQGEVHWLIHACPMDGGAVAIFGDEVVTVWRRESQQFVTREAFDDTSPQPTKESPAGDGENAAIIVTQGGPLIAYVARNSIIIRTGAGGDAEQQTEHLTERGEDPVVVAMPREESVALVLWESQKQVYATTVRNEKPGQ